MHLLRIYSPAGPLGQRSRRVIPQHGGALRSGQDAKDRVMDDSTRASPKKRDAAKNAERERQRQEACLDEALEGTFPASDPPATSTVVGSRKAESREAGQKRGA